VTRSFAVIALSFVVTGTVAALVSGADLLVWELPGGMALGNPLTATGKTALASIGLVLASGRASRGLGVAAVVLALAWYPVSIALAGNLNLNFSGDRGATWLALTIAVVAAGVLSVTVSASARIVERIRRRDKEH